jgi:hypothetical protein
MTIARERMEKENTVSSYKDQMDAQKVALENEWTRVEMAAAEASRQTAERQHALAARETEMREANDQAKIAADMRKAELEAMNAEREFQLEQQKLALEARKLDLQEQQMMQAVSMPAPQANPDQGDRQGGRSGSDATAVAMMALAEAMTRKKSVVRGPDGKVEGIE